MKKKNTALLAVTTLLIAGCASTSQGLRITDLRSPDYFRGDYFISSTFPKIQRALFKHQAACGVDVQLVMDPYQTNYATLVQKPEASTSYEQAIIMDLTQYQANMLAEERVKAEVYSYYANSAAENRIKQVLDAISNPEVCPGMPQPKAEEATEAK